MLIVVVALVLALIAAVWWGWFFYRHHKGGLSLVEHPAAVQKSLYERLGGVYNIAAVVDRFSDALIDNPVVGRDSPNPALREWHRHKLDRLPGLKFMRTLWVCAVAGGPQKYVPTKPGKCPFGLENAHSNLRISPEEFDAVAQELSRTLDHFAVPAREKAEVLAAFAAHKPEVDRGYDLAQHIPVGPIRCPVSHAGHPAGINK